MHTNQKGEERMSYQGAHQGNNVIKLTPDNSREGEPLTYPPNYDVIPGFLPAEDLRKPRRDSTCLTEFGSLKLDKLMNLPYFEHSVSAGYPSSVNDPFAKHLDISRYVTKCSDTAYYFKATGDSMINAGINDNDLLIVDTALMPKHRDVIIADLNGEYKLCRYFLEGPEMKLLFANPDYPPIKIIKEMDFSVHGIVTTIIRAFNPSPYDNHVKDTSSPSS
jgi:DNA polymerase V